MRSVSGYHNGNGCRESTLHVSYKRGAEDGCVRYKEKENARNLGSRGGQRGSTLAEHHARAHRSHTGNHVADRHQSIPLHAEHGDR